MASQSASIHGHHNIIVQVMGDNNRVYAGIPYLRLTPVSACVRTNPRRDIDILNPAYQAVPLVGRESDVQFIREWLSAEPGIAITAVIGPGGSGKTRLALEVLQGLPEGWQGGFLTTEEAERFLGQENLSHWSSQKPTLIVVDYAALLGSTLAKWFSELADHAAHEHRLRILLLERHAETDSGWYRDLTDGTWRGREARKLFFPDQPRRVAPLDDLAQRRRVLQSGLHASAALARPSKAVLHLPEPGSDAWFDQRLKELQWADPLLLLMAAVIATSDGLHAAMQLSRPDLAKVLAERERDRIRNSGETRAAGDLLSHLYACATLCGGLEMEQACDIAEQEFKALRKEYPGGAGQAVEDLARLLGVKDQLPPLQPDLLGEALLPVTLGGRGAGVTSRLARVAAEGVASSLIRSARDFGATGEQWPLEWLQALIAAGQSDTSILMEIADALPYQTVILRKLALEVTKSLVDKVREQVEQETASHELLARVLNKLSNRQSDMGQREAALASIEEAARIYRGHVKLARFLKLNPLVYEPDFASFLYNLAAGQGDMGQREAALASSKEAVRLFKRLVKLKWPVGSNPDAVLPGLASSLSNVAARQGDMGQREAALASSKEAVRLFKRLVKLKWPVESNPDAVLPGLADSLNNLSIQQGAMGQRKAALASIEEAARISRELAKLNSDAFLPVLAISLHNLSNRQSDMGQREAALASIEEAARIRRELAKLNSDAFLPGLADSLNNLSIQQGAMGQRKAALASIEEAARISRELAKLNSDAFLPVLATSLHNLSNRQSDMGQREAALASIEEAARIRRELAKLNCHAFLPGLADSLNNLSIRQGDMGQREAALASIEEAARIHRRLAKTNPDAFLPGLAYSLHNLSNRQSDMGQREAALASSEEAVRIHRRLAKTNPDAFLPVLATSLHNLSNRQSDMKLLSLRQTNKGHPFLSQPYMRHNGTALASIEEAICIRRELAKSNPVFLPDLAGSLNNLSDRQSDMGQLEAALASSEEAVCLYKGMAESNPDAFMPDLAVSLNNLSIHQTEMDQPEAALASIEEAVCVYKVLDKSNPDAFVPDLFIVLDLLGDCLDAANRLSDACSTSWESLRVLAPLFSEQPAVFEAFANDALHDYLDRSRRLGLEPAAQILEPYSSLLEKKGESND
jgi:hypothetical protein